VYLFDPINDFVASELTRRFATALQVRRLILIIVELANIL